VVLESHTRNKKKCVTTVTGLEGFGVKLSEAAKLFGKKFACGASVVKNATGTEQIDMQVGGQPVRWSGVHGPRPGENCSGDKQLQQVGTWSAATSHAAAMHQGGWAEAGWGLQ
jgi:hypothetical protein